METLLDGLSERAAGAAADPHPPRPRGRDRRAGRAVPRPRGLGARARRAAPGRSHEAAAERRAHLRRRDGPSVGARRAGARSGTCACSKAARRSSVAGRELDVEYTPGHASHHVVYFDRSDGTAYVGDVAGVRIPPTDFVRAPDAAARHRRRGVAALDRPGRRQRDPARLALTHFGAVEDPQPHLERMRGGAGRAGRARARAARARTATPTRRLRAFVAEVERRTVAAVGEEPRWGSRSAPRWSSVARAAPLLAEAGERGSPQRDGHRDESSGRASAGPGPGEAARGA